MGAARRVSGCLLLAAAGLVGCGADSDSDELSWDGGQTGSLIPCIPDSLGSVPAGDAVFVGQTLECNGLRPPTELRLADASGHVIELTPVDLGGGSILFRADQAIPPGRYTVSTDSASLQRELVVKEAEPLPVTLGTLRFVPGSGCSPTFEFEFDPALVQYKALLKLSVAIDGRPPFEWIRFGELADAPVPSTLVLRCPGHCLADGPHQLVLSAEVAGEALELTRVTVDFDATCADEGDAIACALPSPGARGAPGPLLLVFALARALRARLRRR